MEKVMTLILGFFSATCMATSFGSAIKGSGEIAVEERAIESYSKIEISGSMKVQFNIADENKCSIKTDDNLLEFVKTDVSGETLSIYTSENFTSTNDILITCSSQQLDFVTLTGSGQFSSKTLNSELLTLSVTGSGNIDIESVKASKSELTVAGSGNITTSGEVDSAKIVLTGNGSVAAKKLQAQNAKLTLSGSGSIHCHASHSVLASVQGSGQIEVSGAPSKISKNLTGSGSINIQ